jgi:tetratricopeptide (TPR) repeat protein/tRNA A-37 threonylcarbamoyl transferase component Bud32
MEKVMKCPACKTDNSSTANFCAECAAPLPALTASLKSPTPPTETFMTPIKELTTGSTFAGRYQVIEELGKGGMGRVYKVFDAKTKEKIALKLLKPEISSDADAIERFGNELRFSRQISHRHVCRMFDIGEDAGTHFITMEYVAGEDLKRILRMLGPMSAGKIARIAVQICEGLAEAHRLGVVHRDLKPQNIMIDREGNVRIMDFGIARSLKVKGMTGAGVVIGTPEYMSPEQIEGGDVDSRSDIYSLGIILYEMATGRVPFEGDTFLSIAVKQKTELPRNPKELNAQLPDSLNRLILRCLEKSKDRRYQKVEDILAELAAIEKGSPTTEKVLPSIPATSRQFTVSFSPRKLVVPGIAAVALIAAAIIVLSILPGKKIAARASARPSIAIVNFENKTGDKDLDKWSTGIRDLLITDLAQSKFLDVLSDSDIYGILQKMNLLNAASYSTGDLAKIAVEGGAQYTVHGSFLKTGSEIIINATCQKPQSRDVVSPIQVSGRNFDEIMTKVREITRKIKADLNLTPAQLAGDVDKSLGDISTPSAEAWGYYVEARKYHFRYEYAKAIPLYQKAIALDPEFIMAYRGLGAANNNIYDFTEGRKYMAKTLELIQRRPERISEKDRYYIEQNYYANYRPEQEWGKALEAGIKGLTLYPEDPEINYSMAVVYDLTEDWDEALKYYEKCITARDRFAAAYTQMAGCFRAKDMPTQAQEVLEKYLREIENSAIGHRNLAIHHISQGRLDLAGRELDAAQTLGPNDWDNRLLAGRLHFYNGDLAGAQGEYQALLKEKLPSAVYRGGEGLCQIYLLKGEYGVGSKFVTPVIERLRIAKTGEAEWVERYTLAYFALKTGRPEIALDECRKAYAIDSGRLDFGNKRQTLHLQGFAYLGLKRVGEAERTAGELKALIERGMNRKAIRLYDHLMGAIELERNNLSKAVEYLERAERSLDYGRYEKDAWFLDTLASAYFKTGDMEKARAKYDQITALTTGRLSYGDIYARAFYMLGQIYEKSGDTTKARENYRKFLDLWKDADPGLPEVPDAQKRLNILH